jgi:hypothetical protein
MHISRLTMLSVALMLTASAFADTKVNVKYVEPCGFSMAGRWAHLVNSDTQKGYTVTVRDTFSPWGGAKPTETTKSHKIKPAGDISLGCSFGDDTQPYKHRWEVVSETPD